MTDPARMLRRQTLLVIASSTAVALLILLAGTGLVLGRSQPTSAATVPAPGQRAAAGRPAYAFTATALNGHRLRLADFAGRPLVLTFFASWCAPCATEAPILRQVALRYRTQIAVVSVATADSAVAARRFAARYRWSWPVVLDADYAITHGFGVLGTPTTFVIDQRGLVATALYGPITAGRLSAVLNGLLTRHEGTS